MYLHHLLFYLQVEYIIVKFDDENHRATVSLRADEILPKLQEKENNDPQSEYCHCWTRKLLNIFIENVLTAIIYEYMTWLK